MSGNSPFPGEELQFRVMRILSARPDASQREVAQALEISLGRINDCIRALKQRRIWQASPSLVAPGDGISEE